MRAKSGSSYIYLVEILEYEGAKSPYISHITLALQKPLNLHVSYDTHTHTRGSMSKLYYVSHNGDVYIVISCVLIS